MLGAAESLDFKLFGDVERIVFQMVEVEIAQLRVERAAVHHLLDTLAEAEQIIDPVVGGDQSIVLHARNRINRRFNPRIAKQMGAALIVEAVDCAQLLTKDRLKNDRAHPPTTLRLRLSGRQILPAQIDEQFNRRELGHWVFAE